MGRQTTNTYIKYRKGSKHPEYDRDVPADIRHIVGKAKWKKSLRAFSHDGAIAEARRLANEHDQIIATSRNPHLLGRANPLGTAAFELAGGQAGFLKWFDQRASDAVRLGDEAASWREHAAEHGPDDDIADPDWASAKAAALDAERLRINRQIARDAPHLRALGKTASELRKDRLFAAADAIEVNPRDPETITLSGVVAAWKEQTSPVAPEQYEYPTKLFEELHGALPMKDIGVDHLRAFRDALIKMPPASGGKYDGMTMQQVIQIAETGKLKPLKASTAGKHFRCLKALFTFAFEEQYINVNVAASIKFRAPKEKYSEGEKIKRRTFSPAEMTMLVQAASTNRWRDNDENMWFLRLMTYTGARPEELAQLSASDVEMRAGHLCLNLHDAGDNHIKNPSSVRKVPVHPELLRLGFAAFVRGASDRPYLFSSLEADGRGRRYGRMQDRLTRLIDGKISKDPRLVPYSMRHGFKDSMRLAKAPEEVVEQIMGHSNPLHRTGRGYGSAQIVIMAEWIAKADPFDKRRVVSEFEDEDADELLDGVKEDGTYD